MPLRRKCCIRNCPSLRICSYHSFPADLDLNLKWRQAISSDTDIEKLTEYSLICSRHFLPENFQTTSEKRRMLLPGVVPTIFNSESEVFGNLFIGNSSEDESINSSASSATFYDASSQTNLTSNKVNDLIYTKRCLEQKLKRLQIRYNRLKDELIREKENKCKNSECKYIEKIKSDANNMDPKATLILDQIKNYSKKKPRWSETTIRHCIAWRFCSPKGYEFPRNSILRLPCKTTLKKYIGTDNKNLIRNRLLSEIETLTTPERICSLVLDDMAVKEGLSYSKVEDQIFGLETVSETVNQESRDTIGTAPVLANQLLCFVIHGLSTHYIIPASYFFHRQLNSKDLYKITLDVLQLLNECGFKVLRIVGDNHKNHVALFKHFGNGSLQYFLPHPYNPGLKLFLSFDPNHAFKNGRNIFLDHNMASSDGIISADYLRELATIQENLIIKPVRFLTRKHLCPSNLEKMKVSLAVQIFSPPVTAALKYLIHHGSEEYSIFKGCSATIKYMEYMYKFFQLHDVSNRTQHIHKRDHNTAPYTDTHDARLVWLNEEFPRYINDIQSSSPNFCLKGLTKETAEALIFTARSTYFCIQYLISDLNFYYVLTRRFNSDPVESIFSNIRLRGGSNDLTDCRAAEYALRQILRSGLIKAINSGNVTSNAEYVSQVRSIDSENTEVNREISIILTNTDIENLETLTTFLHEGEGKYQIDSASTAFLCGYLIMKIEEAINCHQCLSTLRNNKCEKTHPLLELIYNQDRGRLNYPSENFVAFIENVVQVAIQILPSLPKENLGFVLRTVLVSYISTNPIFQCLEHSNIVCNILLTKLIPPLLTNFCNLRSQKFKKPSSDVFTKKRKILKIN